MNFLTGGIEVECKNDPFQRRLADDFYTFIIGEDVAEYEDGKPFSPTLDQLECLQPAVMFSRLHLAAKTELVDYTNQAIIQNAPQRYVDEILAFELPSGDALRELTAYSGTEIANCEAFGKELSPLIVKRFRELMSDILMRTVTNDFSNYVPDPAINLRLTSDGWVLDCPLGVWVDFDLAQMWRNGVSLKACNYCGNIFVASHGRRKYCKRGGCRDGRYRKNKQANIKPFDLAAYDGKLN